jgi:hypothetical protein
MHDVDAGQLALLSPSDVDDGGNGERETRQDSLSREESPEGEADRLSIRLLFRTYRGGVLLTYALFNLENLARLAQPLVLGWAISGLLHFSCGGLALLALHQVLSLGLTVARRMYDTRMFTTMHCHLVTGMVLQQRRRGVEVSQVAARSGLARQVVDFFERDIPFVLHSVYSLVGAAVMLALQDGWLLLGCLGLLGAACVLSSLYGRTSLRLNTRLHDDLEREVDVIRQGGGTVVRSHFRGLASWRVKLSDNEALTLGLLELGAISLVALALVRSCVGATTDAGHISMVLGYAWMYSVSLLNMPVLVEQIGRLVDVNRRLSHSPFAG